MDEFDKYLFDEISSQYAKKSLTQDEYEEVFVFFERNNRAPLACGALLDFVTHSEHSPSYLLLLSVLPW